MQKTFELLAQDRQSRARHGRLTTAHGAIQTPAFMPVGTQGSVKAVSPRELRELEAAKSNELTIRWAKRCKKWAEENAQHRTVEAGVSPAKSEQAAETAATTEENQTRQLVFGIVQGATFEELRKQSAQALVDLDFDGYAIGRISGGEPEEEMVRAVESSEPILPKDKPRYAMGLGTPPQLLEMIGRGLDMFDCVLPTRLARNGTAFTSTGTI